MTVLKESRIFWPLVLFPYTIEHAHTITYTGRCWIKDIKSTFSRASIELTDSEIHCRSRVFRLLIFNLPLDEIDTVQNIEEKPGLVMIQFRKARFGRLANIALSGQPAGSKNSLILNIKNERRWIEAINAHRRQVE